MKIETKQKVKHFPVPLYPHEVERVEALVRRNNEATGGLESRAAWLRRAVLAALRAEEQKG